MRMFTNFLRSSKISVSDVRLLGFIVPVFLLLVSFQVSNAQLSVSVTVQTALMCNGDTNGALQANPDGGTAPYSYHWSNGVSTQIASNLVAETYNVTVTDHNSNTASTSYTLTQPTELAISFTSHPVTCYGGSDGEITASVSGGISPYFYLWGNGNTTDSLSGLPYGEYGITVFDANSCVVQSSFLLTQSLQIKIFQSGILNILCNGASTGYIHITYTGGVSPYQFLWTGGYTTQNIDNVPAGNYTVTLTDSNGCKATKAFTLTQTAVINPVITPVNVVCSADLTGSLSDSITGGTSPYSYTWSTGATTKNISGLGTGTYRVTVTDSNNCKNTASASIIATSLMTFSLQKTDETCYGLNDGSATVNISSGNPVYSYHWSNSGSTATISGLPIGSYNVTVTDGNGCPFVSSSVQIVGPTQIQYSTTVTDVTCNSGSDGAVQLSVSGGTSPYTFAWGNNATTQNISGLHAGDYQVTIYDNNNCNTTTSVTVNQPPALMASLSASNASCYLYNVALSVSGGSTGYSYYWSDFSSSTGLSGVLAGHYSVTVTDSHQCTVTAGISITQPDTLKVTVSGYQNVDCRGNSNGYVHITVTGGTTGYQYSWSNFATTQNIDGISGGTYSVTVTDAKGCVATAQQIINEPASGITAILNVTNVNCHGNSTGAIDLIPSGGTSPYSFLWNNGSTDEDLSGIPAGPYSVAVKDTDNCIYYFSTEVEQPEADLVISNFNVTNINCHGNHNGIVTINVTGGTIPYYYSWSNGATSQNLLGLGPDTYSVVVTDNLGCTTSGSYQVSQPDTLVAGSTYGNILCHGGTTNISVSATGGVAPYSGTGTFTVNAGPYSYTVTDANLCTSITSGSINEPGQLYIDLSASPSSILCNGGTSTITIGAHGGVPPYQGTGDSTVTAGGYLYTVYDSNGCPASGTIQVTEPGVLNISVSANPNPLLCHGDSATVTVTASYGTPPYTGTGIFKEIAGTYSYTVTDNNGCSASQNLTITQPDALVAGSTYGNILCNGGTTNISVTATGGISPYSGTGTFSVHAGPYSYSVSDANGCSSTTSGFIYEPDQLYIDLSANPSSILCNGGTSTITVGAHGGVSPYQGTGNFIVTAGGHLYTVYDSNGCPASGTIQVTEPTVLNISVSANPNPLLCHGDSATVTVTASFGTPPYTGTGTFKKIAGTYTYTVTDHNGCNASQEITITQPSALVASSSATPILCNGGTSTVSVSASGGTTPYSGVTDYTVIAGSYTYSVTDANGCTAITSITITQPGALALAPTIHNGHCFNANDGYIHLLISGGVTPYAILWSTSETTANIDNLAAGGYQVNVTDANGCQISGSYEISQPPALTVQAHGTDLTCYHNYTGVVWAVVGGGTTPYSYHWINSATTDTVNGLTIGYYSVVVTDANNCIASSDIIINEPDLLIISLSTTNVPCNGGTGTITSFVQGGSGQYAYNWSNGATTANLTVVAGTYIVTVTSGVCIVKDSATIVQPPVLRAQIDSIHNVMCYGDHNGYIYVTVSGGVTPYAYIWTNGATIEDLTGLNGGSYQLTVTDMNNCHVTLSQTISEPLAPLTTAIFGTNLLCYNDFTGTDSLAISGGTTPYYIYWNNGATIQKLNHVASGNYSVTVTDAHGCTSIQSNTLTQPSEIIVQTAVLSNVSCYGLHDGAAYLSSITGGVTPFTIQWTGPNNFTSSDQTINNLYAGTYYVNVFDGNNCPATIHPSVTVTQPDPLVVTYYKQNVDCYGNSTGGIDITVTGGTTPYIYAWSNSATTQDITDLSAGSYTLTLTDYHGCIVDTTITIYQPDAPLMISTYSVHNVNCFGGNDGYINITVTGGTTLYSYQWSNGESTQTTTNLAAGVYSVTVTDAHGCKVYMTFDGFDEVTQPDAPLALDYEVTDVSCNGFSDGNVSLTITGGTPPYIKDWYDHLHNVIGHNAYIDGIPAGNYSVVVTDANNCVISAQMTVNQPVLLTLSDSTSHYHQFQVSCYGSSDGWITVIPAGGTSPYTYLWDIGSTVAHITGLAAGSYHVTVTDAHGCISNITVVLNGPTPVQIPEPVLVNISCHGGNNGSINISPLGGTGVFTYYWTGPNNFTAYSQNINNLYVGTYYITVTDQNGCNADANYSLSEPEALQLSSVLSNYNGFNVNCYANNDGYINTTISGGTSGYTYHWSNGATTGNIMNLYAGNYSLTVTDAHGCIITGAWTLTKPDLLIAQANITSNYHDQNISCNGANDGAACVVGQGGLTPYTYLWSNGATTSCISGLQPISYNVTITDFNGCVSNSNVGGNLPWTYNVTENSAVILLQTNTVLLIGSPAQPIAVGDYIGVFYTNGGNLVCGGYMLWNGSNNSITAWGDDPITVGVKEGFAPGETYTWKIWRPYFGEFNATAAYIPIIPPNPPFSATSHYSNDGISGLLSLISTETLNITHTVIQLHQPAALSLSFNTTNVLCSGGYSGSINLTVTGGTMPYTYLWSPGGATTQNINALQAGMYYVTVMDVNNCSVTGSVQITSPEPLSYEIITNDVSCYGGSDGRVQIIPSGGVSPYTFNWGGYNPVALAAGTYNVTITDHNNCQQVATFDIYQPSVPMTLQYQANNVTCYGYSNGSISLSVEGGTITPCGHYSFSWSGPNYYFNESQNINNLIAGIYTVTVTDCNGCIKIQSVTVGQPDAITIPGLISNYSGYGVSCNGSADGSINITVMGGTTPYIYMWDNLATTEDMSGLTSGVYSVIVHDVNNCMGSASFSLTEPAHITLSAVATSSFVVNGNTYNTTCNGNNGTISLSVSGGSGIYFYHWSYGQTTQNLNGVPAGYYTVTVTDSNGCQAVSNTVNLTAPGPLDVTLSSDNFNGYQIQCNGMTANLYLNWSGGASPYNIYFNNGVFAMNVTGNTYSHSGFAPGTYWAAIYDHNGCGRLSNQFTVTQPAPIQFPPNAVTSVSCHGDGDGSINLTNMLGGVPPFTYQWDYNANWSTAAQITGLPGGSSYYVVVWDANGCSEGTTFTIPEPAPLVYLSNTTGNVSCYEGSNGHITPSVSGGTLPYSYTAMNQSNVLFNQIIALPAGTYSVTVTDAHGCTAVMNGIVITQPVMLMASSSSTSILCHGGNSTVTVSATGGTLPYTGTGTYTVVAGTYSYTVSDALGCNSVTTITVTEPTVLTASSVATPILCNGGNATVTVTASGGTGLISGTGTFNRTAGTWSFTVTDANGCTATTSVTIAQPTPVVVELSATQIACYGGNSTVTVSATGGTGTYTGTGTFTRTFGTWSFTVTDANGCSGSSSITISQPTQLTASASTTIVSCNGGSDGTITLSVSGGITPYSFNWADGPTTQNRSDLTAGTYYVVVYDGNGCFVDVNATITENTLLHAIANPGVILCQGGSTNVVITATGGTVPYSGTGTFTQSVGSHTYTVTDINQCTANILVTLTEPALLQAIATPGFIPCHGGSTSVVITSTGGIGIVTGTGTFTQSVGSHTYTVTDANGCTASTIVTLTEPATLAYTLTINSPLCHGSSDGSIDLNVTGGTTPYTFIWNTGATDQNLTNIGVGSYSVTIYDMHSCSVSGSFVVTQPNALGIQYSITSSTCGLSDGEILITGYSGGTAPYLVTWAHTVSHNPIQLYLAPGNYYATITDANNCELTQVFTVVNFNHLSFVTAPIHNVSCFEGNDGSITLSVSGGFLPLTYLWSNGETTQNAVNLTAGFYTVTVIDANGCTGTTSATVIQAPSLLHSSISSSAVSCPGGSNGALDLTVLGGLTPYTYHWNTGATTEDLSNLPAGNYSVTVTDYYGCQNIPTATVEQPPVIQATFVKSNYNGYNISCFGSATGSIDMTVIGGTTPYTYLWSTGATTQNLANTSNGNASNVTYTVTITDHHGCTQTASTIMTQPGTPNLQFTHPPITTCYGDPIGHITLTVTFTGLTPPPPYTYLWSNGATTQSLTNIPGGIYFVTFTDANGCQTMTQTTLIQPTQVIATATTTTNFNGYNVSCFGSSNGAAIVNATGGNGPYTFKWSDPSGTTNQTISGITAGTFNVTVTDSHTCTATSSVILTQPPAITLSSQITIVNCNGNNTGAIDVTPGGGVLPYLFQWSNSSTTQDISNLVAGFYSITLTDANTCTASASYLVTQSSAINITNPVITKVNCYGSATGMISITVFGGSSPYDFNWSNGSTVQNPSGLLAGPYNLTITDAHGCTKTASYTVTTNPQLTLSGPINNVSCFGGNNGAINIIAGGGVTPYLYIWSDGPTSQNRSVLVAGTYNITVIDAALCSITGSFIVTQPDQLIADDVITDVSCYEGTNGAINLTVTGGTTPYSYVWSNGAHTKDISNLVAGNYSVVITDTHSCTISGAYVVNQPPIFLANTQLVSGISCFGSSDGVVTVVETNGVAPFTYLWSNGGSTATISGLATGTYSVTVTDAHGCVANSVLPPFPWNFTVTSTNHTIAIQPSTVFDIGGSNIQIGDYIGVFYNYGGTLHCGGYVQWTAASASFGTSLAAWGVDVSGDGFVSGEPFNWKIWRSSFGYDVNATAVANPLFDPFNFNNGSLSALQSLTVSPSDIPTDPNQITLTQPTPVTAAIYMISSPITCAGGVTSLIAAPAGGTAPYSFLWSNNVTTQTLNNIPVGTYYLTVTDAHGCTGTAQYIVTGPDPFAFSYSVNEPSCYGYSNGSADVTVTGGASPYTIIWTTIGQFGTHASNLSAITYPLFIIDSHNCTGYSSVSVAQPDAISLFTTVTNINCNGSATGAITLAVTGGTSPYTYNWSNGATTKDISGLVAGTYTVIVTDLNGCTSSTSATVTQSAAIGITYVVTDNNCNYNQIGAINITVTGGTSPYTYSWSNGATTEDISGLTSGTYHVVVTDVNGCTGSTSATVSIINPLFETLKIITPVSCAEGNNGSVHIVINFGHNNITWKDFNNVTLTTSYDAASSTLSNVISGIYYVNVYNLITGCTLLDTVEVTEPDPLTYDAVVTNVSCYKGSNGGVDLTVYGGTTPYTYQWSTGAVNLGTTQDLTNKKAGTYKVIVTDAHGCTFDAIFTLTQPTKITPSVLISNLNCNGDQSGSIDLSVSGGITPYLYNWSTGAHTQDISGLSGGTYVVSVTDENGCVVVNTSVVTEPAVLAVTMSGVNVNCYGGNDGHATALVSGGTTPPINFVWSNGGSNDNISGIYAGTYYVSVYDANGCNALNSIVITEPPQLTLSVIQDVFNSGSFCEALATAGGGSPSYTYQWSNAPYFSTTPRATHLTPGTVYTVTVTDTHGCSIVGSVLIQANPLQPQIVDNEYNRQDNQQQVNLTPVIDISKEITVYPNPNKEGRFTVNFGTVNVNNARIKVFDQFGKLIYTELLLNNENSLFILNLNSVAAGTYFLQINTDHNGILNKQLIITE